MFLKNFVSYCTRLFLLYYNIWSDASGNIERAADAPENGDELEGGNNERVLPSRTSDDPIDDEEIEADIVSDPNYVLAEVNLAMTVCKALFSLVS